LVRVIFVHVLMVNAVRMHRRKALRQVELPRVDFADAGEQHGGVGAKPFVRRCEVAQSFGIAGVGT
jgi:hypothetical protein